MNNLVLLCPFHHRAVHEGGWRVELDERGALRFFNPLGVRLPVLPAPSDIGGVVPRDASLRLPVFSPALPKPSPALPKSSPALPMASSAPPPVSSAPPPDSSTPLSDSSAPAAHDFGLARWHGQEGIGAWTGTSLWRGERLDWGWALTCLWREGSEAGNPAGPAEGR